MVGSWMKPAIDSELGQALYAGALRQTVRHRRAGLWQPVPFLRPFPGEKWVFLQRQRGSNRRYAAALSRSVRLTAKLGSERHFLIRKKEVGLILIKPLQGHFAIFKIAINAQKVSVQARCDK